jgi:hypothetical protein
LPTKPYPTLSAIQLPTSARLGAVLTGSAAVERSQLTYAELMTGRASAPDPGRLELFG